MNHRFPHLETLAWLILAGGLALSLALILSGLVWEWINIGTMTMVPPVPAGNLGRFMLSTITHSMDGLSPAALQNLGIAVLLLTPYALVVASMLFFAFRDHDVRFSAITGFVALVLTLVLFL
jgi:uncharacterized membrane protein